MSHHPQPPLPISCLAPCPSSSFLGAPAHDSAYEVTVELDPPQGPQAPPRARLPSEEETMV